LNNVDIKKLVSSKLFLMESFIFTIHALKEKELPDVALKKGVTAYYLGSVILELIVKILFELDHKKTAPFHHNIFKIYAQLEKNTKNDIEQIYNNSIMRRKEAFKNIDTEVKFPKLCEVLKVNEKMIKNFKYDGIGHSLNNAADGQFYNEIIQILKLKNTAIK